MMNAGRTILFMSDRIHPSDVVVDQIGTKHGVQPPEKPSERGEPGTLRFVLQ
jgi:hypothetical protein